MPKKTTKPKAEQISKRLFRLVVAYKHVSVRCSWNGDVRSYKQDLATEIADLLLTQLK